MSFPLQPEARSWQHAPGHLSPLDHPLLQECPLSDGQAEGLRGQFVLVVDDDPDSCWLMRALLEARGAVAKTAGSVSEALDILDSETPTVLVSDLRMPFRDGHDLIREVRAREAGAPRRMPAIAVTGVGDDEARGRALADGFDAVLLKPIHSELLISAITQLVI
jgi:CheY-like chemotaxis protein